MPNDPARVADTKAWMEQAADDLKAAEYLLRGSPPLVAAALFHCQQAAEKVLKGFLAWHDVPFRKTHNLEEIGEACVEIDSTLKNVIARGSPLSEYAWKFRYPGAPAKPGREESEAVLVVAHELYEAMIARLPEEVRPPSEV